MQCRIIDSMSLYLSLPFLFQMNIYYVPVVETLGVHFEDDRAERVVSGERIEEEEDRSRNAVIESGREGGKKQCTEHWTKQKLRSLKSLYDYYFSK